jgi:hypothetical protein
MADICISGLDLTRSSVMVCRVLPAICVSGCTGNIFDVAHWLWKSHSVRPWLVVLQLATRYLYFTAVLMVTKYMQISTYSQPANNT